MSKVFKVVAASGHKNEDGSESTVDDGSNLDTNVDNGCFGVSVDKPAAEQKVQAGQKFTVSLSE